MQKSLLTAKMVLIVGIFILASCTDKYVTQPFVYTPPVPPGYQYSLTTDVQPIFDGKCIQCHNTNSNKPPDLTAGKSYNSIMSMSLVDTLNPQSSTLYKEMYDGTMSGYCTKQDADVVLKWITQGAKNN